MDKPATLGLMRRQNSYRLLSRLQGQRSLRPSFFCGTNLGATLLVVFVFLCFLLIGYKLGEVIADTETVKQHLKVPQQNLRYYSP
jgi:hypothetical protein